MVGHDIGVWRGLEVDRRFHNGNRHHQQREVGVQRSSRAPHYHHKRSQLDQGSVKACQDSARQNQRAWGVTVEVWRSQLLGPQAIQQVAVAVSRWSHYEVMSNDGSQIQIDGEDRDAV